MLCFCQAVLFESRIWLTLHRKKKRQQNGNAASQSCLNRTLSMSSEGAPSLPVLTLKLKKENFVSHHSGTHLAELGLLVALVPLLVFLLQWHGSRHLAEGSSVKQNGTFSMPSQFAFVVLPTILAVMAEAFLWPLLSLVLVAVSLAAFQALRHCTNKSLSGSLQHLLQQRSKRSGTEWLLLKLENVFAATQWSLCSAAISRQYVAPLCCAPPFAYWL